MNLNFTQSQLYPVADIDDSAVYRAGSVFINNQEHIDDDIIPNICIYYMLIQLKGRLQLIHCASGNRWKDKAIPNMSDNGMMDRCTKEALDTYLNNGDADHCFEFVGMTRDVLNIKT